ncbi:transketolase [Metarhizobium album]|uniref:transketolase n=1 Tax=Metarhizobium album TaxID=2182425 RepID=UPI0014028C87|nr:transketolase [Rhizobium album]
MGRRDHRLLANAIRFLTIDSVQEANSGHPGTAMGMADIAEVLWNDFLKHNPGNPGWYDRDRFVQSNGHGSMLTYSLLHLSGYDLSLADLRSHRKMHSKTPGHPEYGITPGVELTTGPLGQGFASAVGMALAERKLALEFNRDGFPIVDHHTYVFAGDGCMMEGISQEAASLAGTLKLDKLVVFYDDNGISIDGEVQDWFADDTALRFRSAGWHVIDMIDGHDAAAVHAAISAAHANKGSPTLICCRTVIGFGSPNKQGKEEAHGAPLGAAEVALTREQLKWPHEAFVLPEEAAQGWDARKRGSDAEAQWNTLFDGYARAHPELAAEFKRRMAGETAPALAKTVSDYTAGLLAAAPVRQPLRKAVSKVLATLSAHLPELIGGSADVSVSTLAWTGQSKSIRPDDFSGNFLHYGVREFGMSAIINGMVAHGGLIPFGAHYLVFSDYSRNAVRMASLMKLRSIFLYTHDSIGVGEDGPTHQPCEQLVALRAIPGMSLWRPGSELEALVAWDEAVRAKGPTVIVAARQDGAAVQHAAGDVEAIRRGGYVVSREAAGQLDAVLVSTGSELDLALKAAETLRGDGLRVRVVSMPNGNIFARQPAEWRQSVLPAGVPTVFVEAASPIYWYQFLKGPGTVIGIDSFGESAPGPEVYRHFDITADRVVREARALLASGSA